MKTLYTAKTPNGRKVTTFLEELGHDYELRALSISKSEPKESWFVRINPNGRIPAFVDDAEGPPLVVFESGAILVHLAEEAGRFLPTDRRGRARVMSWLMLQMSGIGPMMGQAGSFKHGAVPNDAMVTRFVTESRRLFEVLERGLEGESHLAGELSIADFATYPWVAAREFYGVDASGLPNLARWTASMAARPSIAKGMLVPNESHYANRAWLDAMRGRG